MTIPTLVNTNHTLLTGEGPNPPLRKRIAYLLGAGASHACAEYQGAAHGILMKDLLITMNSQVKTTFSSSAYAGSASVERLVNEVIGDGTDIEQVITFLEDAASHDHRRFAAGLRTAFVTVLRERLEDLEMNIPELNYLYAALIDMHDVVGLNEELSGLLTLNYDLLLDSAVEAELGRCIDYGINSPQLQHQRAVLILKLHGSFGWGDSWPIVCSDRCVDFPMWIPPGIQKAKSRYPFNLLWGRAREILECDVLRIIGCRLTANDWDLVSLLFTTQQTHSTRSPYKIEIIDFPSSAEAVKALFPYLNVQSLLDLDDIGEQIISEVNRSEPRKLIELSESEKCAVIERCDDGLKNPFYTWLRLRAELASRDLDSIETDAGHFGRILEGAA